MVWGPFLTGDSQSAAQVSAGLVPDRRVRHYWDQQRSVAKGLTNVLGTAPLVAWDIYLLYGPKEVWKRTDLVPPKPTAYMNLKKGSTTAVYFTGPTLRQRVEQELKKAP